MPVKESINQESLYLSNPAQNASILWFLVDAAYMKVSSSPNHCSKPVDLDSVYFQFQHQFLTNL